MASSSWCLYAAAASLSRCSPLPSPTRPPSVCRCICILLPRPTLPRGSRVRRNAVVCMAPEEEKMTHRSPLDFPIGSFPYMWPEKLAREWWLLVEEERYKGLEWERPKPGRRPDIFSQFSPMKTPLPTSLPEDPPEEDEEEEEEVDPDKEDPEKPEMSRMQRGG
ncbi:unnamed protein product [Musa acuminata subsp. malaccensis]|uniref:(wild Malaysian banana) hypothetical protein n=1 Tax=Musa acuminata subsp. malaccensis TaxID=214687 RepID=A0A804JMF9_MUSAM|nr:unnamed protein product [Musa acuminata subsp. malaccensis]